MIAAQELRIGNKLYRRGIPVTVDARTIFDFDTTGEQYTPILLTPEILERVVGIKQISKSEIVACYEIVGIKINYWYNSKTITTSLNYVLHKDELHWLQNAIYYWHEGNTELTIKL